MGTKILKRCESNNTLEAPNTVYLYSRSQTHRFSNEEKQGFYDQYDKVDRVFYLSETSYINQEITICIGSYPENYKTGSNKPKNSLEPRRIGESIKQKGLSRKQASKIRRSVRILHYLAQNGRLSFLTLTYGQDFPDDLTAKKHLDTFFKRIKRYLGGNFHYVWIAEKQKRGAIHYHLVLIDYIPIKEIFKAWNGVVQKWQKKNGFDIQEVNPYIKGISNGENIEKYLTKGFKAIGGYLTKKDKQDEIQQIEGNIWNCSTLTRKACKGKKSIAESKQFKDLEKRYDELAYQYELDETKEVFQHFVEGSSTKILLVRNKDTNRGTLEDKERWKKNVEKFVNTG